MAHETTIQHKFRPGTPVYVFDGGVATKTKISSICFQQSLVADPSKIKTCNHLTYQVKDSMQEYAEDEVYGTIDEVLQAQRKILEMCELRGE